MLTGADVAQDAARDESGVVGRQGRPPAQAPVSERLDRRGAVERGMRHVAPTYQTYQPYQAYPPYQAYQANQS